MARVTRHTKVIMRKEMDWKAVSISQAERLKNAGWVAVAVSENNQKAQQMIVGLRSNELVDRLLSHLSTSEQNLVKVEIAHIASEFHQNLRH